MGTLTVTAAAFAALPAAAPAGWPAGVTWPGGGNPNGTKSFTISDAHWVQLITWVAATQAVPPTPTAPQLLLAWLGVWTQGTINAVSQYFTTPPVVPPPIVIA